MIQVHKLTLEEMFLIFQTTEGFKPGNGTMFVLIDKPLEHYRTHPIDFMRLGYGCWTPAEIAKTLNSPEIEGFEDELEGAYIHTVFVNPEHRGPGSLRLLYALWEDAMKQGAASAIIDKDNKLMKQLCYDGKLKKTHNGRQLYIFRQA